MAKKYKILKTDPKRNTHEFLVDDVTDLVKLPKETGSLAFMVNTGDLYVCNNLKEWKNVSNPDAPEIVNPSGTLTITENGTGIDVTEYAAVDVNVASNGDDRVSFGEMQPAPLQTNDEPVIGGQCFLESIMQVRQFGSSPQTLIVNLDSTYASLIASGAYVVSGSIPNGFTVDAYICSIGYDQGTSIYIYTSVEEWDGQVDMLSEDEDYYRYGFTMPELGEIDLQQEFPSTLLVFYVH